jgi:hypothetical protein
MARPFVYARFTCTNTPIKAAGVRCPFVRDAGASGLEVQ